MMEKKIIYMVCILLLISFTMIVLGCGDWDGNSGSSGPCPKNRTCFARWENYNYRASYCGSSTNCAVSKAGAKQLTASCDCR